MAKKKILFINQEIAPYVPDTNMSLQGRDIPQAIQEKSHEIRIFMPKWGNINERRGQLHEVQRLSGMKRRFFIFPPSCGRKGIAYCEAHALKPVS